MVGRSGQAEVCAVRGKVCRWGWGDERDGGGEDECGAVVSTEHKVQASAASTFFFFFFFACPFALCLSTRLYTITGQGEKQTSLLNLVEDMVLGTPGHSL